jgi:hypothetical protein
VIAELRRMNEQLGALVAQQQSVIATQRQLISELEQRLGEQDAAHAARAAALEAEVKRLERELLGRPSPRWSQHRRRLLARWLLHRKPSRTDRVPDGRASAHRSSQDRQRA